MRKKLAALVRDEDGQNIVEFALLLPVLMYILMGIIQFGFIFAAYLTINNAVREGARWGTVYIYDNNLTGAPTTKEANDNARNNGIIDRMVGSRGILAVPNRGTNGSNMNLSSYGTYTSTSCPSQTPTPIVGAAWKYGTSTNPDVTICYALPSDGTVTDSDARRGEYMDVQVWYHQQVFIPLLDQFLPNDPVKGAQWIRIPARITVVIN
ncbi:MAG TPA: TadE family protein [Candidatus Limnocylindria bacterium]